MTENIPRKGDTLVTLTCDKHKSLEERMVLAYVFAKIVDGSTLRRVLKFDIQNGEVQFIIKTHDMDVTPVGQVGVHFGDWDPDVLITKTPVNA